MTLIVILIGMAIEHFIGVADEIRRLAWFDGYANWLERQYAGKNFWDGPAGVIATLAGPLLLVLFLEWIFTALFYPAVMIFYLLVLLYCLGPRYLNPQLDEYIEAVRTRDNDVAEGLVRGFAVFDDELPQSRAVIVSNIFLAANQRLFGVLFWFILLGPFGALLYRLSCMLWNRQYEIHGSYSDATRHLYNILNWPTARLLAFSYALTGNMVRAVDAWREAESSSFSVNEQVMLGTGIAALDQDLEEDSPDEDYLELLHSLQGLLNRALLLWLSVLGIMTLSGWLG
jgi:AmpE protein